MLNAVATPISRHTRLQGWQPDAADVPQVPPAWAGALVNANDHSCITNHGVAGSPTGGYPADPGIAHSDWGPALKPTANLSNPGTTRRTDLERYGWTPA